MLKVLAVIRTAFLVFMLGYAAVIWFRSIGIVSACDLQLRRCASVNLSLTWAFGLSLAWLLLETLIGWWIARRTARKAVAAAASPSGPARV